MLPGKRGKSRMLLWCRKSDEAVTMPTLCAIEEALGGVVKRPTTFSDCQWLSAAVGVRRLAVTNLDSNYLF